MNFDFSNLKLVGNEIPWLKDFRLQGQKFFIEKGIPSPKIEEWRYTKPSRYFNKDFVLSYGHTSLKKSKRNCRLMHIIFVLKMGCLIRQFLICLKV